MTHLTWPPVFCLGTQFWQIFKSRSTQTAPVCKRGPGDFPGGPVDKHPSANAGDTDSTPGAEDPTCHGATKPVHHNH